MQHLTSLPNYTQARDIIQRNFTNDLRDTAKLLLFKTWDDTNDMPALIIYGKSPIINQLYVKKLLANYYECSFAEIDKNKTKAVYESSIQGSKTSIEYFHHMYYFEIDFNTISTSSDRIAICELIKSLADHKPFEKKRTVIILRNIENLNDTLAYALRNMFEKYSSTIWFILISCSLSYVSGGIKSRCALINVNLCGNTVYHEILAACRNDLVSDPSALPEIVRLADNDPINFFLLLELPTPTLYQGHLYGFLDTRMNELVNALDANNINNKKSDVSFSDYSKNLRETCIKLTAAGIPVDKICKCLIRYCKQRNPKCLQWVIGHLTNMEYQTHIVNKTIFVLEKYIDEYVHAIANVNVKCT